MTPWDETLSASPCTTNTAVNFSASPTIDISQIPWRIEIDDKIPKRLGGKDLTMHDINKLRYKRGAK